MNSDWLRQTIRRQADIVREIEQRIPIEITGRHFRCQCPRHQDATDPLFIQPETRIFTCFACNWSGDVVDFISETDSVSPEDAMETLRFNLGITLEEAPVEDIRPTISTPGFDLDGLAQELNLTPDQVTALLAKHGQKPKMPAITPERRKSPTSTSLDDRDRELSAIRAPENLLLAWRKVKTFARDHDVYFDSKLFDLYGEHLEANLHAIGHTLAGLMETGSPYQPGPYRHLCITKPKGGHRDIAIMSRIEDRIVIQAILNVLAPRVEKRFSPNSFGHRLAANFENSDLIFERWPELWGKYQAKLRKFLWTPSDCAYVKGDIAAFYDKVDRNRLHNLLSDFTADDWTLGTLDKFLNYKILLDNGIETDSGPYGIPQGPAYAHFLANLYLDEFDKFVEERIAPNQDELIEKELVRFFKNTELVDLSTTAPGANPQRQGKEALGYCRYVDDFFILFRSKQEAEKWSEEIKNLLAEWHLEPSPDKTEIHEHSDVEPVLDEMRSRKYTIGKLLDNDEELTVDQREALYEVVEKDFLNFVEEPDIAKVSGNISFIVTKLSKSEYFQRNEQSLLNLVIELLFSESFKHSSVSGVLKRILPHIATSHMGSRFAEHLHDPSTPDFKRVLFLQAVQENGFYQDLGSKLGQVVLDFLTHDCFFVRFAAANCLWANGWELPHQELRILYKGEKNQEIRARLLHILKDGGPESSFAAFMETAAKEGDETNYHSLVASRKSRDALAKVIRRAVLDRSNTIFVEWLHAILRHGGREAMNSLNQWAENPSWAIRIYETYRIILARVYELYQAGHVTARSILELIENLNRLKNQKLREILFDGLLLPLREKLLETEDDVVRERLIEFSDKAKRENKYLGPMLNELPRDAVATDIGFLNDVGLSYHAYRGNSGNQLDIWEFVEVERILNSGAFTDAYEWQKYLERAKTKGLTDFHDCEVMKDSQGVPSVVRVHYRLKSEYRRVVDLLEEQPIDERRQARIVEKTQSVCTSLESLAKVYLRAPTIMPYNVVADVSNNVKMIGMGSAFCRPRYISLERQTEIVDALHSDSLFLGRLSFEMLTGKCPMKEAKRLMAEGGKDRFLTRSKDLNLTSIFYTRLLRRLTYESAEYRVSLRDPHIRRLILDYPTKLETMKRLRDNGASSEEILQWQLINFADMRLADVWRNPKFRKSGLETKALHAYLRVIDDVEYFCRSKAFALGDHSEIENLESTGMHLGAAGIDLILRIMESLQSKIASDENSEPTVRFNLTLMHLVLRYEFLASALAWRHDVFSEWGQGEIAKNFLKVREKDRFLIEELKKTGIATVLIDHLKLEPLADAITIFLEGKQQNEPFSGCGLTALSAFMYFMAVGSDREEKAKILCDQLAAWEKRLDDCLGNRARLTADVYRDLGEEQRKLLDILSRFSSGWRRSYGVMKDDMGALTTRTVVLEVESKSMAVTPAMVLALTANPLEKNLAKGDQVSVDIVDNQCVALSSSGRMLEALFPAPKVLEECLKKQASENETSKGVATVTPFPTPAGASWGEVSIHFRDGDSFAVSIKAGSARGVYNYTQMGMANSKNTAPTKQWGLLQAFAESKGVIDWKNQHSHTNLKKQKQELSKCLREFFLLQDDPIEWDKKSKSYRCRFHIFPEGDDD